VRERV